MNERYLPGVDSVARLIQEFNKLPGIGPKSAQRLAYYLIRMPSEEADSLAKSIIAVKDKTILCSVCQSITDQDPCIICSDPERNKKYICVVEEPLDVLAIEKTKTYKGLYHVIHGVISPLNAIGPEDLKIMELLDRLKIGGIEEVILAINSTLEGEATTMYIQRLITPLGIQMSRLARGLPSGAEIEYTDEITLSRAIEGRQEI